MASAFNNGTFDFNPEEVKDLKSIINELTFNRASLTELHDVEEGIMYDKQIVFAGRMGLLGKELTGCAPTEVSGVTLTNKFWTPKKFAFRISHCSHDVDAQDKLFNQFMRMNDDYFRIFEGSQSSVGAYLVGLIADAMPDDIMTKAWFSDTAAALQANSGVFKASTDLAFFNTIDGLFKQIFTNIPTTSKYYTAISKNAGTTYAAQALASGDAIAILKSMYSKADIRLRQAPGVQFYVTQTIWDGYLNDLESIQNTGVGNTTINEKGQTVLTFRGIPVKVVSVWDSVIDTYLNTTTKWIMPHRAVLSIPSNLKIGTVSTGDFGDLRPFFDPRDNKNFVDGYYQMDAKHMENYLTVAAY